MPDLGTFRHNPIPMRIGLLSDTHHFLDPALESVFSGCDEIWHAGDFGTAAVADQLAAWAPLRGVFGNIDGADIRSRFPDVLRFRVEGVEFFMTHIGGNLGRYALPVRAEILANPPDVYICGHSHILKVGRDQNLHNRMLFINPGAAGRHGFQEVRTAMRFSVDAGRVHDVEVITLGPRVEP